MVELEKMYSGIAFSPQTKLTAAVNETDTIISVESADGFPDGPNYATIGTDENAETIYYAVKLENQLSGCVRGIEGSPKVWQIGETISRNFTAKDYEAIISNILTLKTQNESISSDVSANSHSIQALEADLSAAEATLSAQSQSVQTLSTDLSLSKSYTLTHSKVGSVHTLSGIPDLQGIFTAQFVATADFNTGDTFSDYSAKPNGEEVSLPDKCFVSGDVVSVAIDTINKKLGFRLGGIDENSTLPPPISSLTLAAGNAQATVSFELLSDEYKPFLNDNAAYIVVLKKDAIPQSPSDGTVIKLDKNGVEL